MRASRIILERPGVSFAKCAILVGGPDWPTSVITGTLTNSSTVSTSMLIPSRNTIPSQCIRMVILILEVPPSLSVRFWFAGLTGPPASSQVHFVRTKEKACSSDSRFRRRLSGTSGHRLLGTRRPQMLCVAAWVWFCLATEFVVVPLARSEPSFYE